MIWKLCVCSILLLTTLIARSPGADVVNDPLRPAAIHTEEVPAVPPALAKRLQQYQSLRAAGFAGWDSAAPSVRT